MVGQSEMQRRGLLELAGVRAVKEVDFASWAIKEARIPPESQDCNPTLPLPKIFQLALPTVPYTLSLSKLPILASLFLQVVPIPLSRELAQLPISLNMSSDRFRLETFRPWDPFQDKAQPLRDSLDTCHYPSPVSITTVSPPSNPSISTSKSLNLHSDRPERHPLPPRPPVEACLNDSLPQEINTRRLPAVEDQASCVNFGFETLDFEDFLHPQQDLPSSGNEDYQMICDNPASESAHRIGFESVHPGQACTTSHHSHVVNAESSSLASDGCGATIDPAILDDYHLPNAEQPLAREEASDVMVSSRSPDKIVCGRRMRPNSQTATKRRRQMSKISKVSVVVDNRHLNRTGSSTRAQGPVNSSFSILRDQYSSLPAEERLQFLSWLFEGALSRCLPGPSRSNEAAASKGTEREGGITTSSAKQSIKGTQVVTGKPPFSPRKRLDYSAEEDRLLVQLREEESLPWSEVSKRFDQRFPGRSQGSIQVHWSTKLKKQRLSLVDLV
jgi:hypothetical protein